MIYILEDDNSIRELVVYSLKNSGMDAMGFERPSDLWKQMEKEKPSLLLLDIMLPEEDGLAILQRLRSRPETHRLPIIMLTAKSSEYDKVKGLDAGADDYVVKPFNIDVLLVRIYNLLLQREKLKSMYGKNFSLQSMGIETTSADDKFMQKLFEIIQDHLDNPDLKVDMICDEMGFSRSNFYRKLKAVTDLSLNDLIRHKRLEVAAQLLKKADMNVTEVSIATGFSTLAYFTKCFKSAYGVSPTEYVKGQPEE